MRKYLTSHNSAYYARIKDGISSYDGCIGKIIEVSYDASHTYITIELLNSKQIIKNIPFGNYEIIKEGDIINMKKEKLTGYKKVAVIQTDGCGYNYNFAIYDDGVDYCPGDKVMVSGNDRIQTIEEVITAEEAKERFGGDIVAEVIGRIDTTAYDKRVEKRKEAKRIKDEMDKKVKEMDELLKYEMYAKQSPEFLTLLDQYKELVK